MGYYNNYNQQTGWRIEMAYINSLGFLTVVMKKREEEWMVATRYDSNDGNWGQGYYGYKSLEDAVKGAQSYMENSHLKWAELNVNDYRHVQLIKNCSFLYNYCSPTYCNDHFGSIEEELDIFKAWLHTFDGEDNAKNRRRFAEDYLGCGIVHFMGGTSKSNSDRSIEVMNTVRDVEAFMESINTDPDWTDAVIRELAKRNGLEVLEED